MHSHTLLHIDLVSIVIRIKQNCRREQQGQQPSQHHSFSPAGAQQLLISLKQNPRQVGSCSPGITVSKHQRSHPDMNAAKCLQLHSVKAQEE